MKTIEPKQMQELEKSLFIKNLLSSGLLMEKAAFEIVRYIEAEIGYKKVIFICGPGNNGGDGFAAARIYKTNGGEPIVWKVEGNQSTDCEKQEKLLEVLWPEIQQKKLSFAFDKEPLGEVALIVDCIFGTGLSKPITGELFTLITFINSLPIPKLAVDIPTGIHGKTGETLGIAVQATATITFHRPKIGLYLNDGLNAAGQVHTVAIGIPSRLDYIEGMAITKPEEVKAFLGKRKKTDYKGTYGHVLMITGSRGMAGAAIFAAEAALKAGAGLVTVASNKEVISALQSRIPSAMGLVLWDEKPFREENFLEKIRKKIESCGAIVFGPGWGREYDWTFLVKALSQVGKPVIWDADALFYLQKTNKSFLPYYHVLTPHLGEMATLLGEEASLLGKNLKETAEKIHTCYGGSCIAKGARSICYNGESFWLNPYCYLGFKG